MRMRRLPLAALLLLAACNTSLPVEGQADRLGASPPPMMPVMEPQRAVAYTVHESDLILFFPFDGDGYCLGQFTAEVQETAEVVEVGDITEPPVKGGGACAGVGTVDSTASVFVPLSQPLGTRTVIRKADGSRVRRRPG